MGDEYSTSHFEGFGQQGISVFVEQPFITTVSSSSNFLQIIQNKDTILNAFSRSLDVRNGSRVLYSRAVSRFIGYLQDVNVTQPTRQNVLDYKEYLRSNYAANTANTYLCAIKQFFSFTEEVGVYPDIASKVKKLQVPKGHKKDDLSIQQASLLLDSLPRITMQQKRDYAIINLMLRTGLRDIEVSRACIKDIRSRSGHTVLYVHGKGRDEADDFVILTQKSYEAIMDYLKERKLSGYHVDESSALFASFGNRNADGHMTTRSISRIVKSALVNAGYDSDRWTAHSLRHSAVSIALAAGASIIDAKDMARHSSVETTMIYTHNSKRLDNGAEYAIDNVL